MNLPAVHFLLLVACLRSNLRAATVNAAELLGRAEIGSLQPGKFADIVAIDGDPLADVTVMEKVVFVMKGGEVYKSASK